MHTVTGQLPAGRRRIANQPIFVWHFVHRIETASQMKPMTARGKTAAKSTQLCL